MSVWSKNEWLLDRRQVQRDSPVVPLQELRDKRLGRVLVDFFLGGVDIEHAVESAADLIDVTALVAQEDRASVDHSRAVSYIVPQSSKVQHRQSHHARTHSKGIEHRGVYDPPTIPSRLRVSRAGFADEDGKTL